MKKVYLLSATVGALAGGVVSLYLATKNNKEISGKIQGQYKKAKDIINSINQSISELPETKKEDTIENQIKKANEVTVSVLSEENVISENEEVLSEETTENEKKN